MNAKQRESGTAYVGAGLLEHGKILPANTTGHALLFTEPMVHLAGRVSQARAQRGRTNLMALMAQVQLEDVANDFSCIARANLCGHLSLSAHNNIRE